MDENYKVLITITTICFDAVIILGMLVACVPNNDFNLVNNLYILFILNIVIIFIMNWLD